MLQRDSLSTGLPIENSPPGIHTIPAGTVPGAGVEFGTVGAKADETAEVSDPYACPVSLVEEDDPLDRAAFMA